MTNKFYDINANVSKMGSRRVVKNIEQHVNSIGYVLNAHPSKSISPTQVHFVKNLTAIIKDNSDQYRKNLEPLKSEYPELEHKISIVSDLSNNMHKLLTSEVTDTDLLNAKVEELKNHILGLDPLEYPDDPPS
jgi:hypothetical protein